MTTKLLNSR